MKQPLDQTEQSYQSFSNHSRNEYHQYPPNFGQQNIYHPAGSVPKKSKFVSTFFSVAFPGTGHFYLGLFHKGLMFMFMFITNILLIAYFAQSYHSFRELPLIMFSLLIPVIYLYALFDSLHQIDAMRRQQSLGGSAAPPMSIFGYTEQDKATALLFWIPLGCLLVFLLTASRGGLWGIFSWKFSYIGIVMLLTAGATMYLMSSKKKG